MANCPIFAAHHRSYLPTSKVAAHPSRLTIHPFYERLRAYPSACQILARSYLRTVSTAIGCARAFEPKAQQAFSTRRFIQMP